MPRAVIFSMLIGATIYILLQVVFIGALPAHALAHGWANISFAGIFGPFAGLAKGLGLAWLAYILYADAIIAPTGSGLIYTTTTSRITFGMSKNGHVPAVFEKTTKKSNVPVFGLIFTFLMGLLLFLPFPGWQKLVGFITSATVLMYAGAPLALGALRLQKPDAERPYRLPWAQVLAPASFVSASLIIYWSGWEVVWKLMVAVVLGYVLMGISRITHANPVHSPLDWKAAIWLWPYLAGLTSSPTWASSGRPHAHPLLLGHGGGRRLEPHHLLHRHPAPPPDVEGRRVRPGRLRVRELTVPRRPADGRAGDGRLRCSPGRCARSTSRERRSSASADPSSPTTGRWRPSRSSWTETKGRVTCSPVCQCQVSECSVTTASPSATIRRRSCS